MTGEEKQKCRRREKKPGDKERKEDEGVNRRGTRENSERSGDVGMERVRRRRTGGRQSGRS